LALLAYTIRIIGLKLLAITIVSIIIYSMVSAYISLTLVGLYTININPEPEDLEILSIYSGVALTPLTGLVERSIVDKARSIHGVVYAWSEVTIPSLVNNTPLVIRGVDEEWIKARKYKIIDGNGLDIESLNRAWLGIKVAEILKVNIGDIIVVKPIFTRVEAILIVSGVIEAGPPYDYEILVPITVGYIMRGLNNPSVVRIAYDPETTNATYIMTSLGFKPRLPAEATRLISALIYKEYIDVKADHVSLHEAYISRLGVPRELIIATAVLIVFTISLLALTPAWLIVSSRRFSFRVLIDQGASIISIKATLVAIGAPIVLLSTISGYILASSLEPVIVLGYPIEPSFNIWIFLAHIMAYPLLYIIGLVLGDIS